MVGKIASDYTEKEQVLCHVLQAGFAAACGLVLTQHSSTINTRRRLYTTLGTVRATGGISVGGTCMICWSVVVRVMPTCVQLSRRSRARVSVSFCVPPQHPTMIGRVGTLARNRLQR